MITITTTETLPRYRIELITPSMIEEAVELAEEFVANQDDLSKRTIEWILDVATGSFQVSEKNRDAYLVERVHKLATEILVDMIRYLPLKEPVIDREGHTWSRALYDSYKANFELSPLSGKPFSAVEPHRLAARTIALVKPWMPAIPEGTLIAHELRAPQTLREMAQDYAVVVNSRRAMRNRAMAALLSNATSRLGELERALGERIEREEERGKIEREAQAAQVESDMAVIKERHRGENRQLGEIVRVNGEQLDRTAQRLEEEKTNLQNLWAAHQGFQAQVNHLRQQLGQMPRQSGGSVLDLFKF